MDKFTMSLLPTILVIWLVGNSDGVTVMVEPGNPSVTMFVQEGDSFTLACRDTQAKPILWERNGTPLSTYGQRRPMITTWTTREYNTQVTLTSLIVREAGLSDEGMYGCSGTDERPQRVNIVVLALRTSNAQLVSKWPEGNNEATLKCDPDKAALFDATMTWYKDGVRIQPGNGNYMLLDNNRTLYIKDLHYPNDVNKIGKYECVLKLPSRGRTYTKRAYINAAAIVDQAAAEETGQDVAVFCQGHAYPLPLVTWHKDGSTVHDGSKYTITTTDQDTDATFRSTLLVKSFDKAVDLGNYTCIVDSFKEDYVKDDAKMLHLDNTYYQEISSWQMSKGGLVIGCIVAVVVIIYIGVVVVVLILMFIKKKKKGAEYKLAEEEDHPEAELMLVENQTSRLRRDTASDSASLLVPDSTLRHPLTDTDTDKDDTGSIRDGESTGDDSSIHKEKIPTSDEDSPSSPESSPVINENQQHHEAPDTPNSTPRSTPQSTPSPKSPNSPSSPGDPFDSPDGRVSPVHSPRVYSKPPQHNVPVAHTPPSSRLRANRPPSVEDLLEAEAVNNVEEPVPYADSDSDEEPPVLPPKQNPRSPGGKRDTIPTDMYLDMTGSLGRGGSMGRGTNGRRLGEDLPEDDSSIDGDEPQGETEAVIETSPKSDTWV